MCITSFRRSMRLNFDFRVTRIQHPVLLVYSISLRCPYLGTWYFDLWCVACKYRRREYHAMTGTWLRSIENMLKTVSG